MNTKKLINYGINVMEYKYLSDGRKVAVIGKLNNDESIVQEIFITESGDEVPSGERFVTKSLHDLPVISYKEKQLLIVEKHIKTYEKQRDEAEKKNNEIHKKLKAMQQMLKSTESLINNFNEKDLDRLTGFMTGTIEYLVVDDYKITAPVKMIDKIIQWGDSWGGERAFEGLKLVSVMGKSDGDLGYRVHRYSDGSGSGSTDVYPCADYEEAINKIKDLAVIKIKAKRLYDDGYSLCLKLGVIFDSIHVKEYRGYTLENNKKILSNAIERRDNEQIKVDTLTAEIEKIN